MGIVNYYWILYNANLTDGGASSSGQQEQENGTHTGLSKYTYLDNGIFATLTGQLLEEGSSLD